MKKFVRQPSAQYLRKQSGSELFGDAMIEAIEAALQPIRNSLEVDGFDLRVDGINDGIVSVVVFAGPDACLECLIPEEHFKLRIEDKLKGLVKAVRLRYPQTVQPSH